MTTIATSTLKASERLRRPTHKQAYGVMVEPKGTIYRIDKKGREYKLKAPAACALGEILFQQFDNETRYMFSESENEWLTTILPLEIQSKVVQWNDECRYSFAKIADLLEKEGY